MTPFLYRVAKAFYSKFGADLYRHTFVFPNRRAGVFFQKYLMEIAGKPIFSPDILTIQDLFTSLSVYQKADKVALLVLLYEKFIEISGSKESFDDFVYWGEMLLSDFDDVDKHLVDARQLFRNLHDLKSLEDDFSYLTATQIEAIRRFWRSFEPYEHSDTKKEFLETWKILFELYTAFHRTLHEKKQGYEGMIFREVAMRAKNKEALPIAFSHIVFVGLNALTQAEAELLRYFQTMDIADFYWDYESPLIQDPQNRASRWMVENFQRFPSKLSLDKQEGLSKKPTIELIGIPSGVGQAKHVHAVLQQWINEGALAADSVINTAIVLPDENLLIPTLYSIPEAIDTINVTMGYGLSNAAIAALIRHVSKLQHTIKRKNDEIAFYYRDVLSILNHPLLTLLAYEAATSVCERIQKNNMVVVAESEFQSDALLSLIFRCVAHWTHAGDYLRDILSALYQSLTREKYDEENVPETIRSMDLEREFIVQYHKTITRLEESLRDTRIEMNVDTYFRLLNRLAQSISVPFSGEPLAGLQVMGVLETRVIDFENLILLSMNEGVFPLKKSVNSFIPYTLRKGFDLTTYEHQDSTYAYHFYRMIYRAKRVAMIYDTRTEGLQTGEVSRYFYQLNYLYHDFFDMRERVATYNVMLPETASFNIPKTHDVMCKLHRFLSGGDRALSASAINTYISCPLQFYFLHVEQLSEEKEVQESVEADIFGTMYHHIMEQIFDRYKNQVVTDDVLQALAKDDAMLTALIAHAFAEHQYKQKKKAVALEGYHAVIGEILKKYLKHTLLADAQFTPFTYIDSEYRFNETHQVSNALCVNLKGSIDRVDHVNERYRIIDYKTGGNDVPVHDIAQLFDGAKDKRPKEALQAFFYAWMYAKCFPERVVQPAIYFLRKVFDGLNPAIVYNKNEVVDFSILTADFEEAFNACLTEIFDAHIVFSQTEHAKTCEYCTFREVCGR